MSCESELCSPYASGDSVLLGPGILTDTHRESASSLQGLTILAYSCTCREEAAQCACSVRHTLLLSF